MNERRLACIHLPDFPLVLYSRLHPEVRAHPLVLTTAEGETATVTICNARAAQYDVAAGMTVARANSLCPGLVIGVRECGRETAVLREIGGALAGVGPEIEIETGGVIFLESARLGKLYGDEPGLARRIQAVLQPFGYPVAIGFAANKFVALTAARQAAPGGWVIVPSGSESAWLQQLQVEHLALSDDTAETLSDLGIATVGQAAALPANEVVERFGAEGAVLARRARGDDPEPFTPDRPAADWCATAGLDSPVRDAATILAHIEALLKHLLAQPGCAGCAVREIQVCLHLDDRTEQVFTAAVEQPSTAAARFLRQVRLALERMSPAAAVRDITLRIPHPCLLYTSPSPRDS
ncbi:MAG: DNA polymerase Y family protein, partial [candidate division Zixibacteria bacterium]|nr:DNA polymerase Y family protein [candidate division Zixibacteria bacterium]